ncbi:MULTISPECIES: glycosyltransferase [Vibrio]|uniref:glycosyltransferase n=1 Tax=Vibrio TaxID=662 RepID=UPI00265B4C4A|nr:MULTISPECIES: glycosyltransferase [unclassified Vibrio]MCS0028286.1 glycosyltransferase [Vibrio alginolyticus]MDW1605347.1 glycosyltransferase [Vibrio sp. Vb2977]MDW1668321.1 glycosyltransferase [Vibrio sp. Vb2978]MDW1682171.1 glycosyltransferase [Vibrio sp. Vb2942]
MKLVTIYIVTHNRSQLLKRAIESAYNQTYENIEVIVVDDASTDDTQDVIKQMQTTYPLKYFRNDEGKGACYSRNVALNAASGELITGMDDDDYFGASRVDDLVGVYEDKYSLVCANIIEVTIDREIHRKFGFEQGEFDLNNLMYQNLVGNQMLTSVSKLKAIGGFDEAMPAFQDYDTWVRLVDRFGKGYKTDKYNYYLNTEHAGERISSSSNRKTRGFELFFEKHQNKMNADHKKSMEIMRYKVTGETLPLLTMARLISRDNYKSALSLFLKQRNLRK